MLYWDPLIFPMQPSQVGAKLFISLEVLIPPLRHLPFFTKRKKCTPLQYVLGSQIDLRGGYNLPTRRGRTDFLRPESHKMATREHFSTLEVVTEAGIETIDLDFGKQVVTEGGIEAVNSDLGKQVVTESGIEAVDQPVSPVESYHQLNPEIKRPLRSRKLLWITASVVLLAVIFGAVLGGVLGSMKLKRPQPHLAPSSTTTPSSIPSPPPVPGSQSNLLQRRIAAISSDYSSNTTHLYYQDNNGTLFEGTLTPSSETWDFRSIGYVKLNCTGIAAAVSRPGFPSVG